MSPERNDRPLSQRPTRNARPRQHCEGLASRRRLVTSTSPRAGGNLTAMLDVRLRSFGNPLLRRQGGTRLPSLAKRLQPPHGCCSAQTIRQVIPSGIPPLREFRCCNAASSDNLGLEKVFADRADSGCAVVNVAIRLCDRSTRLGRPTARTATPGEAGDRPAGRAQHRLPSFIGRLAVYVCNLPEKLRP